MEKSVVVSVRFSVAALRKLQLLSQVYQCSVGELIRAAADKHIKNLTRAKGCKKKVLELQEKNARTLESLLLG